MIQTTHDKIKRLSIYSPFQNISEKQFFRFHIQSLHQEKSIQGIIGFGNFLSHPLVSFKVMPMSLTDMDFYLNLNYRSWEKIPENLSMSPLWMEFYILQWCRKLIECHKTIHLPFCIGYKYYWNERSQFTSTLQLSNDHPHFILFSEKANSNLKEWCLASDHSFSEWKSVWGQIVFGLLCLQYYVGVIHNDFHWGNILVYECLAKGHWKYSFNNQDYYIPNHGQLLVPWDFAMSCLYPDIIGKTDMISEVLGQDILQFSYIPLWIQKENIDRVIPLKIQELCQQIRNQCPTSYHSLFLLFNEYLELHQPINPLCQSFMII